MCRGLDVITCSTWGDAAAPTLVMLHGWMDVGASFQFLVDALARDWHVIAPDLRGFGRSAWQPQRLLVLRLPRRSRCAARRASSPDEPVRLVGHSLGGNVVMHYAGVRPARVRSRRVARRLRHSRRSRRRRAAQDRAMARRARAIRQGFTPYDDLGAVADRLQKNNPRLPRDKAEFLARTGRERCPTAARELHSDPRHKLPFPTRLPDGGIDRRSGATSTAPVLWVAATESEIPLWLERMRAARSAATDSPACGGVLRMYRNGRLVTIADAGHMLHHDQPAAVARRDRAVPAPPERVDAARPFAAWRLCRRWRC